MTIVISAQPLRVTRRHDGDMHGLLMGRTTETGVYVVSTHRWMIKWRRCDSLLIALGRLRVRVMKPSAFNLGR